MSCEERGAPARELPAPRRPQFVEGAAGADEADGAALAECCLAWLISVAVMLEPDSLPRTATISPRVNWDC
jgi:hypothetical protein